MDTTEAGEVAEPAVWPHIGAYILLSGGLTMVFLAASTLASAPAIALPGLVAPALVAIGLAMQQRVRLSEYLGTGLRRDITALATVFGPFVVVLAMVIAGQPRILDVSWSRIWPAVPAALAEMGWWGYLYPLVRTRIQPLPASVFVGFVHIGWLALLAWAGVNPLAGSPPLLLAGWSISLALLTAAILEFRPWSLVPVFLLHLGLQAAIAVLPFTPESAAGSRPMRTGVLLLVVFGFATMVTARGEAVSRARHARMYA
jgi:hypothetical protein